MAFLYSGVTFTGDKFGCTSVSGASRGPSVTHEVSSSGVGLPCAERGHTGTEKYGVEGRDLLGRSTAVPFLSRRKEPLSPLSSLSVDKSLVDETHEWHPCSPFFL